MKKKILLPIIFLTLGALVGCGGNKDPESTPTSSEDPVTSETESVETPSESEDPVTSETESEAPSHTYTWEISNEAALTAEWHVGDADRQIEITSDPAVNLTTLLTREEAYLTSSDTAVVGVQGSYLKALSAGTATITLEFDNQTDSVEIEVLPLVENITTIAEAFELSTGPDNVDQPDVTLKAVVTHILGTSAMVADGTGFMYVYDSGFAAGVKVGDYVKVTGEINQYQQYTPQLKSVGTKFEILTETAPVIDLTPTTLTAAQWDAYYTGESYTEYVEGYATVFKDGSYINFYYHETLDGAKAALPGSVRGYADGANFCADACVSGVYKFKGYLYGTSCEVNATTGDVTLYRQNLYAAEYEEVKAPSVSIPEPKTITVATLAEALENPAEELKQKFHIDGVTVSKLGQKETDTTAGIYGNIHVTDGTTTILSYGATATASALTWGEAAGAYSFDNPKDFDSNELTKGIAVGDTLNIDFVITSYKGTKQLNTIITAVNAEPDTPVGGEPAAIAVTTLAEAIDNPAAEKSVKFTMSGVTVSKLGQKDTDTTAGIYGNIHVTDGTTTILSYGATATASALAWDDATSTYVYTNPKDFESNDLTKGIVVGDKLDITFIVTSYKGAKQLNTIITAVHTEGGDVGGDVGGGDEGGDTPVEPTTTPEPAAVTVTTIAEAVNNAAAELTQKFTIEGVKVTAWGKGTDGTAYGNFYITDGTTSIYVYGATATASALVWSETNASYTYTNAKDFLTNDLTKTIVIDSEVDLTFVVTSYKETKQLNAIVTAVDNSNVKEDVPVEGQTKVSVSLADYAKANGWTNQTKYTSLNVDDVITATVTGGQNSGKYYDSGTNWRLYQTESATLTISASGEYEIVSVKISYVSDKTGCLTYNSANVATGTLIEVGASSITYGVGNTGTATNGQARITAIEVIYAAK